LRSAQYKHPQLFAIQAGELPLSGSALAQLMQAVLARGKPFRFRARGWSMSPFIQDGDVITVAPLQSAPPKIGEVVAFIRPGMGNLVVHRVVAWQGTAALIQGDSIQDHSDGLVPQENLLGRVKCIERKGHPVWLGLGPERILIAWLSRSRMLIPARNLLASCLKRLS
jgi:hypothetical protein